MIAARLVRADQGPPGPREPAGLPLVFGGQAVGRDAPHAPVDAQRSLTPVLHRELRVRGKAQDVTVGVDDHRLDRGIRHTASSARAAQQSTVATITGSWLPQLRPLTRYRERA